MNKEQQKNYDITAKVCKQLHDGDSIETKDLKIAIKTIEPTLDFLSSMGKEFHIVWKHLNFDFMRLIDFKNARGIK